MHVARPSVNNIPAEAAMDFPIVMIEIVLEWTVLIAVIMFTEKPLAVTA